MNKASSEKGNIFQWAKVSRNVGLLGESVGLSKQGNPRAARMRLWKVLVEEGEVVELELNVSLRGKQTFIW